MSLNNRGIMRRNARWLLSLSTLLMLPFLVTAAEHLNCKNATENVGKIICSDRELAELDFQLNAQYKKLLKDKNRYYKVFSDQKAWLKERSHCVEKICLKNAYKMQINKLNNYIYPPIPIVESARLKQNSNADDISINQPFPEKWGYVTPEGIYASDNVYVNKKGEYIFPLFWINTYARSKSTRHTYLAFFSSQQIESENMFTSNKSPVSGYLSEKWRQVECPLPSQNNELFSKIATSFSYQNKKDDLPGYIDNLHCQIVNEHTLKNGNIIRYVNVVGYLISSDYDFHERYFNYFAMYDANGRLLKRITPLMLAKTEGTLDICGDSSQIYMIKTSLPSHTGQPVWLDDDSFIIVIQFNKNAYVLRIDANLETKWKSMNDRGLFLLDTTKLEQLGHVHKDPKKSCLENEIDTDAAVVEFLKLYNK